MPEVWPAALTRHVGHGTGAIFAIILLNASIIGAAAVTLSTSYAFGDVFGARHSLHRSWRDAKFFYGTFSGMVALAAGLILIPGAPLGVITTAVQALAGVLLPSATVFLLLLCNDKGVLGPWVNKTWLNIVSSFIVSVLLMMSLILMATTMFSTINVRALSLVLGVVLLIGYVVAGALFLWGRLRHPAPAQAVSTERRDTWRMPPLSLLDRPKWSRGRLVGMYLLARLPGRGGDTAARQGGRARDAQVTRTRRPQRVPTLLDESKVAELTVCRAEHPLCKAAESVASKYRSN